MATISSTHLDLAEKVLHADILLIIHYCVPQSDCNWWVGVANLTGVWYRDDETVCVGGRARDEWNLAEGRIRPHKWKSFGCGLAMRNTYTNCLWNTVLYMATDWLRGPDLCCSRIIRHFAALAFLRGRDVSRESEPGGTTVWGSLSVKGLSTHTFP